MLLSSTSSVDKDHHHHHHGSTTGGSVGSGSSGISNSITLSGQSAVMEIEKLLLKFDGNYDIIT